MNLGKIFKDWQFAVGCIASAVVVVAVLLSVYLIVVTYDFATDSPFLNSISVSGKGEVTVIPNIATFNFSITEAAEDVETAQKNATEKTNKALEYLEDNDVEEKDLKTTGYSVYPKYQWVQTECFDGICPEGTREVVGYEVRQTVTVKVREIENAGELLSGIGALGISNISGLSFTSDDPDSLKDQARRLAIADAKEKAKTLEKDLGIRLGKIISFGEDSDRYSIYEDYEYSVKAAGMGISESSISPEIPTGEQTVTYNVYLDYEVR